MNTAIVNKVTHSLEQRAITSRKKALDLAKVALDHKALDLKILDVSGVCSYADYFIILSSTSGRHSRAVADALTDHEKVNPSFIEGYAKGDWVLLDLNDVVVHIFHEPVREYYNLDKLWADAEALDQNATSTLQRKASS